MAEFERIVAKVEADTSEFTAELRKAAAAAQGFEKGTQGAFGRAGTALKDFTKQLVSIRSAMVLAGGATGLLYFSASAYRTAEQLIKTSERVGLTTTRLQELRFAAEVAGMSTQDLDVGLRFLSRNLGEAARGAGENRYILEQLGLVGADVDTALRRLADAFASSSDATGKMNLALQLFGRGGFAMVDILNEGSAGIDRLASRANQLGVVLSEDVLRRAAQADDQLDELFAVFKKISLNLAMEFIPVMVQVAKVFTDPDFIAGAKTFAAAIGDAVGFIAQHGEAVTRFVGALAGLSVFGRLGPLAGVGGALLGALGPEAAELLQMLDLIKKKAEEVPKIAAQSGGSPTETADGQKDALEDLLDPATKYNAELEKQNNLLETWDRLVKTMPWDIRAIDQAIEVENAAREKNIDMTTRQGERYRKLMAEQLRYKEVQAEVREILEAVKTEQEKVNEALQRLEELRPHLPAEVYQRRLEQLTPHLRRLGEAADEMGQTIASSFEEAIFNAKSFQEVLQGLANDLARIMFRKTVTEPLAEFLTGGLKGAFGLSSARGNAFSGPILPFARGGVVSQPLTFPMARGVGLMGEKGPEAILPLRRTRGGDLGVRAEGGGGRTEVNIYAPPGSQVREERQTTGDTQRIDVFIDQMVADSVRRPGTRTFRALRDTFALSQQGINR